MPDLDLTIIKFENLPLPQRAGHKLRGFFARAFEDDLLHNHQAGGGFLYRYPRVQYKVIDGVAHIIGIDEGGELLRRIFFELGEIRIDERVYPLHEKQIRAVRAPFGFSLTTCRYRLLTPWLGLNQRNLDGYNHAAPSERANLLERVLVGNCLSLAKSFDCRLTPTQRLTASLQLRPVTTHFKGKQMAAFTGQVQINFRIPDLLGLGKSCARGFGTLIAEEDP